MTAKDTTSYAAALPQVVMAVGAAVDRGFITKATAVQIIETVSGRLGVTFDAKEELDAVLKEMTDKQHEDTYSASPEDLENGSGQEAQ
jgi:hypothetical protein